jgi:hypothetical protein
MPRRTAPMPQHQGKRELLQQRVSAHLCQETGAQRGIRNIAGDLVQEGLCLADHRTRPLLIAESRERLGTGVAQIDLELEVDNVSSPSRPPPRPCSRLHRTPRRRVCRESAPRRRPRCQCRCMRRERAARKRGAARGRSCVYQSTLELARSIGSRGAPNWRRRNASRGSRTASRSSTNGQCPRPGSEWTSARGRNCRCSSA